jgi:hypothetical protein
VVINLWATSCGPCVAELPEFVTMNRMYRRRNFELITISLDDPRKAEQALQYDHLAPSAGRDNQESISPSECNWEAAIVALCQGAHAARLGRWPGAWLLAAIGAFWTLTDSTIDLATAVASGPPPPLLLLPLSPWAPVLLRPGRRSLGGDNHQEGFGVIQQPSQPWVWNKRTLPRCTALHAMQCNTVQGGLAGLGAILQHATRRAGLDRVRGDLFRATKGDHTEYFAGLSLPEAAESLGIPTRTAERLWAFARAWLRRAIGEP